MMKGVLKSWPKTSALVSETDSSGDNDWMAPAIWTIDREDSSGLILYGRELIANTSTYLGPKGSVARITNGMNCQNCHLQAGSVPYSNSFAAVASVYPLFRPRSGVVESIEYRVNDCLKRSLNGKSIDSAGREMRAFVAYLKWIGQHVPKNVKPKGAGVEELPYLDRAADAGKGAVVYSTNCMKCHGANGEGMMNIEGNAYIYPPLWGKNSYNTGAGLYRLARFAGFVKYSMPPGANHESPQLKNEDAWDVAAYVNTQARPRKDFPGDWPDIKKKAIDIPFGPYADSFTTYQHKYGPYKPIKDFYSKLK